MRIFDRPIYGPGVLRSRGSRVLLAAPGVAYPDAVAEAILAQAIESEPAPVPTVVDVEPEGPQPDEHGIVARGNGWYELPDGRRVRGHAKALAEIGISVDPGDGVAKVGVEVPADGTAHDLDVEPVLELKPLSDEWFELPDGERVRGIDQAEEALEALIAAGFQPPTAAATVEES